MTKSILVVGAGLFGCIIARHLRRAGHVVEMVDNAAPWAASKAAGCLIKPSWLSSMTKAQQDVAYALLDHHYGLKTLPFKSGVKDIKLQFVNPDFILAEQKRHAEVSDIGYGKGGPWAYIKTDPYDGVTHYRAIILATGIATVFSAADGGPKITPQWGISYRVQGQLPDNRFSVWAPYRQLLRFNINEREIWLGDGAAWKEIGSKQELSSLDRAKTTLQLDPEVLLRGRRMGARPYVEPTPGDPCYLKEMLPGIWVATGGAKNGTMAAAWCASKLERVFS